MHDSTLDDDIQNTWCTKRMPGLYIRRHSFALYFNSRRSTIHWRYQLTEYHPVSDMSKHDKDKSVKTKIKSIFFALCFEQSSVKPFKTASEVWINLELENFWWTYQLMLFQQYDAILALVVQCRSNIHLISDPKNKCLLSAVVFTTWCLAQAKYLSRQT